MALVLLLLGCAADPPSSPDDADAPTTDWTAWCRADADAVDAQVEELVARLTIDEAAALTAGTSLLFGTDGLWRAPGHDDLPELTLIDGPRGVSRSVGPATAFPVGAARGATWDPALEERVGRAMGAEARAYGADVLLAPTINVLRHPRWGRAQETYGEDPHHLGRMGAAFVVGAQDHVIATPKHLVANSIEDTRFEVDVQLDDAALREIYLPAFEATVEAGAGAVMTAYNDVNGAPASEYTDLVRGILKDEWGFPGFVMSDWVNGVESTDSLAAGLDLEMPVAIHLGPTLADAVRAGDVDRALLDDAVRRLARTRLCFAADPVPADVIASAEHADLAREVALRSTVLLTNDGTVPLAPDARIALLGRLADRANIGDTGSSAVDPPHVVTVLDGLVAAGADVTHLPDWAGEPLDHDVAVVVVGLSADDEGESLLGAGDRASLALRAADEALVRDVAAVHPRTVVVLQGGSAIDVEAFVDDVAALWMAWYPGQEGGHALADLLLGHATPSGRLPIAWPRAEADLPAFDNTSLAVTYDRWHGYRHLDRQGLPARFPFGFGLSTTTFTLQDVVATAPGTWAVTVANTGSRDGLATVQAYARGTHADDAVRELVAFAPVSVDVGDTATAELTLDPRALTRWTDHGWADRADPVTLELGWHAGDVQAEVTY